MPSAGALCHGDQPGPLPGCGREDLSVAPLRPLSPSSCPRGLPPSSNVWPLTLGPPAAEGRKPAPFSQQGQTRPSPLMWGPASKWDLREGRALRLRRWWEGLPPKPAAGPATPRLPRTDGWREGGLLAALHTSVHAWFCSHPHSPLSRPEPQASSPSTCPPAPHRALWDPHCRGHRLPVQAETSDVKIQLVEKRR